METTVDLTELDKLVPFSALDWQSSLIFTLSSHNYVIKPEYSDELKELKEHLENCRENIEAEYGKVANDLNFDMDGKTLHLECDRLYGHTFRLTRKVGFIWPTLNLDTDADSQESSVLRGKSRYIELTTRGSGVVFTTETMRALASEFKDLNQSYERKQSSLVKEVIGIAGEAQVLFSEERKFYVFGRHQQPMPRCSNR